MSERIEASGWVAVPIEMERAVMDWVAFKGVTDVSPALLAEAENAILRSAKIYIGAVIEKDTPKNVVW